MAHIIPGIALYNDPVFDNTDCFVLIQFDSLKKLEVRQVKREDSYKSQKLL